MRLTLAVSLALLWPLRSHATLAQPVPLPEDPSVSPQVEIDGVGIATGNYANPYEINAAGAGQKYRPGVDFTDSALLVGAAQRLYDEAIGSMGLGFLVPDSAQNQGGGNAFFLHQAFVDFQAKAAEVLVGRSDNPSAHLVDFPTLREEDLITFTNPLNPFADGVSTEEHRYSNVAAVTWNQDLQFYENFHAQHLLDPRGQGETPTAVNSVGATFQYLCAPGKEALSRLVSAGIGVEHQFVELPVSQSLTQLFAGGVANLNESVTDRVDFRVQDVVNLGSSLVAFNSLTDTFQARYNAIAASVRYLHSPFGRPGFQLSLTGGYRSFFDVAQASSSAIAFTAVKRLGEGFDAVAQVHSEWRDPALAAQYGGKNETAVEAGFVFNFAATFNQHLGPRRTPLNYGHGYLPD